MEKPADVRFPVHELIARRWSPLSFADRLVERDQLGSLLEAARWAASSFNEQPWSFFVATREEPERFERLAGCLVPGNQTWARRAPVLMLSVAKQHFERNGKPNRHAFHDVGLAVANLVLQAEALGLAVHQMAGFDADRARSELAIPADHDPVAALAVGYPGEPGDLPEELRGREAAPRTRKALEQFVYGETWGSPLEALGG